MASFIKKRSWFCGMTRGKRDHHLSGEMELTQHTQIPTCLPMKIGYWKVYNGLSHGSCKKDRNSVRVSLVQNEERNGRKWHVPWFMINLGVPGCTSKEINYLPWFCPLVHG